MWAMPPSSLIDKPELWRTRMKHVEDQRFTQGGGGGHGFANNWRRKTNKNRHFAGLERLGNASALVRKPMICG
jgi:hypothetical protein